MQHGGLQLDGGESTGTDAAAADPDVTAKIKMRQMKRRQKAKEKAEEKRREEKLKREEKKEEKKCLGTKVAAKKTEAGPIYKTY